MALYEKNDSRKHFFLVFKNKNVYWIVIKNTVITKACVAVLCVESFCVSMYNWA